MIYEMAIRKPHVASEKKKGMVQRYWEFCDRQMRMSTVWFLIPLMSLSAAIMPMSILLMSYFSWYILFVGISILMFFGNIILNIAGYGTRKTITFYLLTVLFNFLSPLLSWVVMVLWA